jgi:hypothetical protein
MSNVNISPNMNLPVPNPTVDPGPDWATNIAACMAAIDSHNHSTGEGVPISGSGIVVSSDFALNGNNLALVRSVRFNAQGSPISGASDLGCVYVSGVDLYYNDESGNQIRLTRGGAVTGATGTITGLPSGTASASYSGGTFTFQSATNTPANMEVGPLAIGSNTLNSKTVTLGANTSQPISYNLTWPIAAPAANQVLLSDGSGNFTWSRGLIPLGSVIATFPNLTGAYTTTATTTPDANGYVLCQGQTLVAGPMTGAVVPNINNNVFILGNTTSGTSGGSSEVPAHTHTFTSTTVVANSTHTHNMSHNHQWQYSTTAGGLVFYSIAAANQSVSLGTFTTSPNTQYLAVSNTVGTGSGGQAANASNTSGAFYTSGSLNQPNGSGALAATGAPSNTTNVAGTTDSTGSVSSTAILPPFITAVYLMRAS